jgi:hypothetical protein
VDLFQTHCYAENLAALGIELGTSGFAARNSDHYTTEVVHINDITIRKLSSFSSAPDIISLLDGPMKKMPPIQYMALSTHCLY